MSSIELTGQAEPRIRARLADEFRRLGVAEGMVLIVHSSLSSLGWVCGGAVTVIDALLDALGPGGTLVVPTHSGEYSDPAHWVNPPVPETWWPIIRDNMPAFDPARTPSTGVGVIPESVRTWPGASRSNHPRTSFAAIGPDAEQIVNDHALTSQLGEESPLARMYDLDGYVLLLGVGHGSNTSLHLAEYRVPDPVMTHNGAAIEGDDGRQRWASWSDVDYDSADFEDLGRAYEAEHAPKVGRVGSARSVLIRQRDLVDFAVAWMTDNRPRPTVQS